MVIGPNFFIFRVSFFCYIPMVPGACDAPWLGHGPLLVTYLRTFQAGAYVMKEARKTHVNK